MLSLSLHKLHSARQLHSSSLRRSVLICNMLRYIEEETGAEAHQAEAAAAAAYHNHGQDQPYWSGGQGHHFAPPPTPNPYRADNSAFSTEAFEAPLKDFNSAFRQTPLHSSEAEGAGSCGDEERGINWSSVLSLTSQNELDPLNNNTFSEVGGGGCGIWATSPGSLAEVDLSQNSFDDISWKLSPISADDVMKAFPEENMFECAV